MPPSKKQSHISTDYSGIFAQRADRLKKLRADPELLEGVIAHYRRNPWDFISDWGMTYEPRNIEIGLIPNIPFVLWPRQIDYLKWAWGRWQEQERGLVEKSRDCGVTWLSVGMAVCLWCFEPGFAAGFGSRKEELVDKRGDSKSIFEKVRFFIGSLPREFLPYGFVEREHMAHMRIINPENGASLIGEAGYEIGRGGRTSMYFVDEAAFIERQEFVDRALSQNTNCQIDISTPNGNGNLFYKKRMRFDNSRQLFIFDWRDDPRKDMAWYRKMQHEHDEVTVAQEIDRDYNASAEDAFIPAKWVASAIDSHKELGFEPEGVRVTGFDPADVGDAKAVVNRHGSVVLGAVHRQSGDITQAIPWAFELADTFRADVFEYDGDGMGAPTMKMALQKKSVGRMKVEPFHGSSKPDGSLIEDGDDKLPKDRFVNRRAQAWSLVRERFRRTHDAVERARSGQIVNVDPEDLVSISSGCEMLTELQAELSRPKRIFTANGRIMVEQKKDMKKRGVESPNLADAFVIAMSARKPIETLEHVDYRKKHTGHRPFM